MVFSGRRGFLVKEVYPERGIGNVCLDIFREWGCAGECVFAWVCEYAVIYICANI